MTRTKLRAGLLVMVLFAMQSLLYAAEYPRACDVESIDGIIGAYYDVISGPKGHRYDAARDQSLHAPGALITRAFADGTLQRHDLASEQEPMRAPYAEGFYEVEPGRIVEEYGNLAHVWSTYEMRNTPDGAPTDRGVNSISLYYSENRWWIASWSTQLEEELPLPAKYLNAKVTD